MKKILAATILGSMLLISGICYAEDSKELLTTKQTMLQERKARIEAQAQLLQQGYMQTEQELKDVTTKLDIINKKEAAQKKDETKKEDKK